MVQTITLTEEEYNLLVQKAQIADDALIQLKLSLKDLMQGKVSKF